MCAGGRWYTGGPGTLLLQCWCRPRDHAWVVGTHKDYSTRHLHCTIIQCPPHCLPMLSRRLVVRDWSLEKRGGGGTNSFSHAELGGGALADHRTCYFIIGQQLYFGAKTTVQCSDQLKDKIALKFSKK